LAPVTDGDSCDVAQAITTSAQAHVAGQLQPA
jgi:hypothetical protein